MRPFVGGLNIKANEERNEWQSSFLGWYADPEGIVFDDKFFFGGNDIQNENQYGGIGAWQAFVVRTRSRR